MGCMFYDGDTTAVEHESLLDFSRMELCNVSHCHLASADTSKADAGNGSDRQAGKWGEVGAARRQVKDLGKALKDS